MTEPEIESGNVEAASAAVERLLAVTEANLERRAQLERALESRILIEQAKGIVAERYGLGLEEGFRLIRKAARTNRMKLRALAGEIRPGGPTPPALADILRDEGVNV